MKKMLVLVLALVCALAIVPVSALTANGSLGTVPLYKGAITVDGKLDKAYTELGLKLDVNKNFSDSYKTTSSAVAYLLHDGTNIYMHIHCNSAHAIADSYNPLYETKDIYKSNCLEVMFDFSNDAKGQADCFKVQTGIYGKMYGEFLAAGKETTVIPEFKTIVDKAAKTIDLEYKIKIQEGAKAGSEIGFNLMYDSDPNMGPKNESKQCQIACVNPGVANAAEKFVNLTLGNKEVALATTAATTKAAATAAKTTSAAAKTADTSVVVALVATVALAGVVVCKKKH